MSQKMPQPAQVSSAGDEVPNSTAERGNKR